MAKTRRTFLKAAALAGTAAASRNLFGSELFAAPSDAAEGQPRSRAETADVALRWLAGAPLVPGGVTWGVPWGRGALPRGTSLSVIDGGKKLATQSWPLAYWPDGSVKWTGLAIAADAALTGPLTVTPSPGPAPAAPLQVRETSQRIEIVTGTFTCVIARGGANLIESLAVEGREVARAGRLIALREDRSEYESSGTIREQHFTSSVSEVTVEQTGPVRAVVHLRGMHAATAGDRRREWLPFSLRLYFTAGLSCVRMVHSFVFDGDQATDFIRGLGIAFTVPFREETQNRHIRFATDGDGLFSEPAVMVPGYRPRALQDAAAMNAAQMQGKRIPNLSELTPHDRAGIKATAVWDSFKLTQLAPDSFSLDKRTGKDSSWLHFTNGSRSRGLAFLGDVSGGLAVGMKRFWQKYPAALEINGASSPAGEMKIWFWSPDARAMDLRHYDTVGHDLNVTYEDYQQGFSTPEGVANTNELTIWATSSTPDADRLVAMAKTANDPPLLICAPQHYHGTKTLGIWSLPDTSTADLASAEVQLDRAFRFYQGEVERRRWYGFWDFGDFIRTYDPIRHEWMYDIGGHGWNNTELMPNAWLWYAFLRSGRADIFRLAEDMHRNTTEVDVHHTGRFAGLGSRHNVNHWGDGAKEARINEAFLKRFYFYLTTDERTGDLIREPLATVEQTLVRTPPLREVLTRTVNPVMIRIGPDWLALASNWMTEWERTGETRWRDYILTGMRDIGAMPEAFISRGAYRYDPATKHLYDIGPPNMATPDFMVLFGGDQIIMELIQLIDCPEFANSWRLLCQRWAQDTPGSRYTHMRIVAYAANFSRDPALERKARELFHESLRFKDGDFFPLQAVAIEGPSVSEPVQEILGSSSFTQAVATPETAQWAISLMTAAELFRQFRP